MKETVHTVNIKIASPPETEINGRSSLDVREKHAADEVVGLLVEVGELGAVEADVHLDLVRVLAVRVVAAAQNVVQQHSNHLENSHHFKLKTDILENIIILHLEHAISDI